MKKGIVKNIVSTPYGLEVKFHKGYIEEYQDLVIGICKDTLYNEWIAIELSTGLVIIRAAKRKDLLPKITQEMINTIRELLDSNDEKIQLYKKMIKEN